MGVPVEGLTQYYRRPPGGPRQEIEVHAPPAQDEAIKVNFQENISNNLERQQLEREKLELEQQLQQQREITAERERQIQQLEGDKDNLTTRLRQQQDQMLGKERDLQNKNMAIVNFTTRLRAYERQKNEHVKNSRHRVVCYAIVCIALLVAVQDVMDISMQDFILKVATLNSEITELQNNSEELRALLEKTKSGNAVLRMGQQKIQMQLENCKSKIVVLKKEFPKTCKDARQTEDSSGNMVKIFILGFERTSVRCNFHTDEGNWLVILRRADGSVDFDRNWNNYINGFGDLETEFWFGLDKLHHLTSSQTYELRIDMENFNGEKKFAKYGKFEIASSSEKYKLTIGEYSGDAGDSFSYHDQKPFSTKDHDNFNGYNCAKHHKGGWWFHTCHYCHLNGPYVEQEVVGRGAPGIKWMSWRKSDDEFYRLKIVEVKIRPVE
uniref:techylectin-5B-like n=1 Tax=Styela clava TaxID=7725 RepID=UPI00193A58A3|nr:techylectin-5B-like [Styela clava]